ncbi:MAG: flagellar motor protein MotB [Lachnospiraceae bacterium]|nr:flagellar motor protein MotB [Lachnospiraceae bacterium]
MGRQKKQDDPPAGSPAWMATFSDLMNLLLCFFVLLFSMSTIDEAKLNEIIASMNSSFSVFTGGATSIGEGILISNGVSQLNDLAEYINSMGVANASQEDEDQFLENDPSHAIVDTDGENAGSEGESQKLEEMAEAIEEANLAENEQLAEIIGEAIYENGLSDQVGLSFTSQYILLTMKGSLMFDSGSAALKTDCYDTLDKIALILERYAGAEIEIEGHTDNVPISGGKYASNEELSSARALSVFYYLLDNSTLDSAKLKHAGMGDRVPIADNSTAEGRSKNRRVEIRIYNVAN